MFPMKIALKPANIGGRSHWPLMTLIVRVGFVCHEVMTLTFPIPSQVFPCNFNPQMDKSLTGYHNKQISTICINMYQCLTISGEFP